MMDETSYSRYSGKALLSKGELREQTELLEPFLANPSRYTIRLNISGERNLEEMDSLAEIVTAEDSQVEDEGQPIRSLIVLDLNGDSAFRDQDIDRDGDTGFQTSSNVSNGRPSLDWDVDLSICGNAQAGRVYRAFNLKNEVRKRSQRYMGGLTRRGNSSHENGIEASDVCSTRRYPPSGRA